MNLFKKLKQALLKWSLKDTKIVSSRKKVNISDDFDLGQGGAYYFKNFSSLKCENPYQVSGLFHEIESLSPPEVFQDATIYGKHGIVVNKSGLVLTEPSLGKRYYVEQTGDFKYLAFGFLLRKTRLKGSAVMLSASVSNNYFMWVVYFLPLLRSIQNLASKPVVILCHKPNRFQEESLNMLGINEFYLLGSESLRLQVEKLIVPHFDYMDVPESPIGHYNLLGKNSITWLNQVFSPSKETTSKIYLTREHTNQRRILNEQLLYERLKAHSFQIVDPGKLQFQDQVRMFSSAQVIVSAHGAALTNIVFSRSAKVFEFYPDNRTLNNPKNLQICNILGHEYHLLLLTAQNTEQDMIVDEEVIEYILTKL